MTTPGLLLIAATASATLAIACELIAERHGRRPTAFLLLKPLTTVLIAASLLACPTPPNPLLIAAFLFALGGDIALMFEGPRAFLCGLGSFFIAHLAFVAVFLDGRWPGWPPLWALGFVIYAVAFFRWLLPKTGELGIPTLAYGIVLTLMVLVAAAADRTQPDHLALAGALLFAFSDSALAIRQFASPYRGAQPLILASYWLAMGLIAASRWPSAGT